MPELILKKPDGTNVSAQADTSSNELVSLGTKIDRNDKISAYPPGTTPVPLTASGQVLAAPGQIVGFYVNSTSSGTIRFADSLVAGSGYLGGAITPSVGWNAYPAKLTVGGYATIASTLDVTVFVIAD